MHNYTIYIFCYIKNSPILPLFEDFSFEAIRLNKTSLKNYKKDILKEILLEYMNNEYVICIIVFQKRYMQKIKILFHRNK